MLIPEPLRLAAGAFAEGGPHPCLYVDGTYLVATDRVQLFVAKLPEPHNSAPVSLPLDVGNNVTIMDGFIMSERGVHETVSGEFPNWRDLYRRIKPGGLPGRYDVKYLARLMAANDILGGGDMAIEAGGAFAAKCSIGNGQAQVFWMPLIGGAAIDKWEV